MKSIITLVVILFLFVTSIILPSQLLGSISDSGLVAKYIFDGNANDISGNNNNGTVINATLTTDRFGNSNHAYLFNGVNSVITIPNSHSIGFSNSIGISAWIYLSSIQPSGNRMILGKSNYITFTNYLIRIKPFGYIQWEYNNYNETINPLLINQWYHLYVDAESPSGEKRVFVNGVQVSIDIISSSGTHDTVSNPLTIGAAGYFGTSYNEFFHGKIDDIRIFNRLLSQTEITDLNNELNPNLLFRSVASGNWNSLSTWQVSTNSGSTWIAATYTPNNTNGAITIQNTHTVTVTANDSADQVTVNNGGQIVIDTLVTLRIIGINGTGLTLNNGGMISGKGRVQTEGKTSLQIITSSGFKAACRIKSDTTTCAENSVFVLNGNLFIDTGATLYIQYNNSSIKANGDVVNNGTITGNNSVSEFIMNGPSLSNNGSIKSVALTFLDTTLISGSGNFYNINVEIDNGGYVSLSNDISLPYMGNFYIENGSVFELNSKTVTIDSGILFLSAGATISDSGTIQTQGTPEIRVWNSYFKAQLRIESGTTTLRKYPGSYYNGNITIDSGASMSMVTSVFTPIIAGNDVVNNGTIIGTSFDDLEVRGPLFVNNGSVTGARIIFSDTTSISGTGNFSGGNVDIDNGGYVYLLSDVNYSSIGNFNISNGGVFNPNSRTLSFNSGILFLYNGGTISNSGTIETQGTPEIRVYEANFNAHLTVKSGTTTLRKYPGSFYNGIIKIDSAASLNINDASTTPIILSSDVINNGNIIGSSSTSRDIIMIGGAFVNNSSIMGARIIFTDTTSISGTGNFNGSNIYIDSLGYLYLVNDVNFSSIGNFNIINGGVLNPNGKIFTFSTGVLYLNHGGTISNSGTIQSQGSSEIKANTNFNATLRIKSGTSIIRAFSEPTYNGTIIIDSGATMNLIDPSYIPIIANNNIFNNGTITGSSFSYLNVTGHSIVNNGIISNSNTSFGTGSHILQGNGNWLNSINMQSGSIVTLGSDHQFSSLSINNGAIFDLSSKTLKLSSSVTPLTNNGTLLTSYGTIEYNGTSAQSLVTTNINYGNIKINNPAGVSLPSNLSITGLLSIVIGDLNLNGRTLTLLDTARLQETPGNIIKGNGSVTITKVINKPNSLDVGGLGVVITSNEYFGLTTITRINNSQDVAPGKPSVRRYYDISPQNNTALNANIIFKYDQSELDTLQESSFGLYRSTNSGINYNYEGGIVDTINNQISLNYVQSFSRWTAARDSIAVQNPPALAGNLYIKGKYPIRWGSLDTVKVRILQSKIPNNDSTNVNFVIKQRETFEIIFDSTFTIPYFESEDTTLNLRMPFIGNIGPHSVIVQAIPDVLDPINGFDIQTFCFDVTCDQFSYIEPCDTIDGGAGFNGHKGRITEAFSNLNTTDNFPIHFIEHSFIDSSSGNVPYKLAIYADDGSGKPGSAVYVSPVLTSPPGTGNVETVSHEVIPPVNIPPLSRFHIGIIQTTSSNIKVSYQDEIPVRSNAFYFSNSDSGNVWYDFADSSKNFRIDLSPKTNTSLTINAFLEGFYNSSTNLMKPDTVKLNIHSFNSPYALIDSSISILDSNGTGIFSLVNINTSSEYFFAVRHRNHLETWSHNIPEKFNICDKQYNFTDSMTKAYGNNMIQTDSSPLRFAFYSGDVNQDGIVDGSDGLMIDNDAANFNSGYLATDLNGDEFIDGSDAVIADNNAANFVSAVVP